MRSRTVAGGSLLVMLTMVLLLLAGIQLLMSPAGLCWQLKRAERLNVLPWRLWCAIRLSTDSSLDGELRDRGVIALRGCDYRIHSIIGRLYEEGCRNYPERTELRVEYALWLEGSDNVLALSLLRQAMDDASEQHEGVTTVDVNRILLAIARIEAYENAIKVRKGPASASPDDETSSP